MKNPPTELIPKSKRSPTETDAPLPNPKQNSSRRTQSFSSTPSSFSIPNSPFSSISSLSFFNGIPFSWEQKPGIPKHSNSPSSKQNNPSLLPLPPPIPKKKSHESLRSRHDPFIAALMECSKDGSNQQQQQLGRVWKGEKVSRNLSDRFHLYVSCKSTCSVTDSHVFLPRSNRPGFYLLNRRSG